ncbi:amidohydrolase family protein [uncultured Jatrophihabitans sp.]|uniref:amidohydrolase family protein n=1 Tax=uncultured Jatrophihabitans sp. TaxID=1610747 RepID=UPI0035CA7B06
MLIVDAEVAGMPGLSVRTGGGRVAEVGRDLSRFPGEEVLDARGGAVIPGLHDHHVHLRSAVAAASSVALDPLALSEQGGLAPALRAAARQLATGEWLRGVGISGPWAETLDRWDLDAVVDDRPVRVQHRTGELWVLNSAAVRELDVQRWTDGGVERTPDGTATGRLWRLDHRLRGAGAGAGAGVVNRTGMGELSSRALRLGITGFTDATPGLTASGLEDLESLEADGSIRQRLTVMAGPELPRLAASRVRLGPQKIVLDDACLPGEDELVGTVAQAHRRAVPVAIHCVTAAQLVVAVAGLRSAGGLAGDRIEHAGVVPPGYADELADLRVTVVTQPGFIAARGEEYLRDVSAGEQPWLYPCASLRAAGVAVAAGSDAPFGPLNPWVAMRAAVSRRAASGAVVGAGERVDPVSALGLYLGRAGAPGHQRRVAPGEPGDLCVLRHPLTGVLTDLGAHQVAAVVVRDEVHTWER